MKSTTPIRHLLSILLTAFTGLACGQTWVQTGAPSDFYFPSNYWGSIACSADGSKVVAGVNARFSTAQIFRSIDGGASWAPTGAPLASWRTVSCSADGARIAAVPNGAKVGAFTSADSGATWGWHDGSSYQYTALACSADGSSLLGAALTYHVYLSRDFGATWTTYRTPINDIGTAVAFSADGTTIVAGSNNGDIASSTDGGLTWSKPVSAGGIAHRIAGSADLKTLIAIEWTLPYPATGESIVTSTNMGQPWVTNRLPAIDWYDVAASADGTKLVAVSSNGLICSSDNSGATWATNNAPALRWYRVASSADGNTLFAISWDGGIWVRRTVPAPVLQAAPANSALKLSWLVPSANFQLQQTSNLGGSAWSDVTNQPALNLTNLDYEVVVPQSPANVFFRLVKR